MKSVNVLVIEDETDKLQALCDEVTKFFVGGADITTCGTFSEATRLILQRRFDLIIADLLLPRRRGDDAVDISEELVEHIAESELNQRTTVVAVSRYPEVVQARNGLFTKSAVFLVSYADPESWKSCLRVCMQRVAFRQVYDFVIICALEEERNAFEAVNRSDFSLGALFKHDGLDCREMSIGDKYGVCVVQPRMGLVDAGIVSARALNAFSPRLICMAGICAGFRSEVKLGSLIVSDVCWEHQAGKWRGTSFQVRSYQEGLKNDLRISLSQLIGSDINLIDLASKAHEIQVSKGPAVLLPTVSGSAVIASADFGEEIKKQHGKVAGLDMEVFGVYRAATLHDKGVLCFAAKAVVDYADEQKSDESHVAGAMLSARFVVKAIAYLLP